MLLVFKKSKNISHLLLALGFLFFSFDAFAHGGDASEDLDTLAIFHESETRAQVLDHFELKDRLREFLFEIYYLDNHSEPYLENVKIIIGYKFKDDDFRRLGRKFGNDSERQYCSFGEPQVMERSSFADAVGIDLTQVGPEHTLGRQGEYLILPVFKHDEQLGECNLNKMEFEVFSIEALREEVNS